MSNSPPLKITSQVRQTCLKLAVDSCDPRDDPERVVSRALVYEQYLSGEVAERIAAAQAERDLAESGIEIVEGQGPDLQPAS